MKMTDDQLLAHLDTLAGQSSHQTSAVAREQAEAMDYYLSRPFGSEEDGRSQVISSDVWDVVEGLTPLVLKPFVSSDDIVRFAAEGPEDEEAAEQESDYINYVVTQQGNIFETLVNWVKTGLLQKNGVVKYWWDDSKRQRIERYFGLTDDVYAAMIADDSVKVIEHTEHPAEVSEEPPVPGMPPEVPEGPTHDVVLRIEEEYGHATYAVVPPEELRINVDATSSNPQLAKYVEHTTRKTISELREMGFDVADDVSDTVTEDPRYSEQYTARRSQDQNLFDAQLEGSDPAMREVIFRDAYMLVDYDGDGRAELRRVCRVGSTLLLNEEAEE
ncbi:MAG: hypothetical protein OEU93_17135, partial [Rubrivivax sp.]|nr:hypothetical protein [Rubrivivax sp.]